jgi:tetratricopeptide (TPR) repeat protein
VSAGVRRIGLRGTVVVVYAGIISTIQCRASSDALPNRTRTDFVGSAKCAACHADQFAAWKGSQHAAAMQEAGPATVLGHFDSTRFSHDGLTSTFIRRGDRFIVNTEGPDGSLRDFEIRYTFGVAPLQQYLVEFPGGRLQPLTVAWDARPAAQGGQRWFSLEPSPRTAASDELHWSGRGFNWNYMCADCHSTGVRKHYDARADEFHTTFAEIDVACEACHGPGSAHATWGGRSSWVRRYVWRDNGLTTLLRDRRDVAWAIDSTTGNAHRSVVRTSDREIETCAQCHARREHIADGYTAGAPLLDFYDPFPLLPDVYYPDGQQEDEAYDYASFLQSRMHAFGVTCADCHDPHTQKLRRPGNLVCAQCHRAAKYDTTAHHGHSPGSPGAACAACHMPPATYMEIDPRHDHSLRIPRPDRTVSMGVPNACTRCHTDRSATWAVEQIGSRSGKAPGGFQRFAETFAAVDQGAAGAADSLARIVSDAAQPAIVRASALARLRAYPGPVALRSAEVGARDPSPLVRRWALEALRGFAPNARPPIAAPLLSDPTRAVRQAAASLLAAVADSLRAPEEQRAFESAAAEFVASQRYNADRAENRVTLGTFYVERGHLDSAAAEFRTAVSQWPHFLDAYTNLAGVLSLQKREPEAEAVLRNGLSKLPSEPHLHHALGLSLARAGRLPDATTELAEANRLSSYDPEFAYPYAVILHGTGRERDAIGVLESSQRKSPNDRNVLYALGTFLRDAGEARSALRYATELMRIYPDDNQAKALVRSLQTRKPR